MSPLNSIDGAEPLLKYNGHLNLPKFDIKKVFVDGQDVCLLYEMNLGTPPVPLLVCLSAHVNGDGKINSYKVVFDPGTLLQQK